MVENRVEQGRNYAIQKDTCKHVEAHLHIRSTVMMQDIEMKFKKNSS